MAQLDSEDKLKRIYARLLAIKKNAEADTLAGIRERLAEEYNSAVRALHEIGYSVDEFLIRVNDYYKSGGENFVFKTFFLTKVDSIINYFELLHQEPEAKIGFKPKV